MKCQSYGFAEAARILTSTLSPSISGLRTSLSSSTSAEPYFSYAIAFILFPSWSSLTVYTVHLSAKCRCTAYTCQEEIQMAQQIKARRRVQLTRDRVLRAAVALADNVGIEALSMRKLAEELGDVLMALYKHVANKEKLLDVMIDVDVGEIEHQAPGTDWKTGSK